jgi:hypothetical protein
VSKQSVHKLWASGTSRIAKGNAPNGIGLAFMDLLADGIRVIQQMDTVEIRGILLGTS